MSDFPKEEPASKSKPVRSIEVKTVWQQPQHNAMLIQNDAGEQALLPLSKWSGQHQFNLPEDVWQALPRPDVSALLVQAGLTETALTALFARVGIISPETVNRPAVAQLLQHIMAKIDLLK